MTKLVWARCRRVLSIDKMGSGQVLILYFQRVAFGWWGCLPRADISDLTAMELALKGAWLPARADYTSSYIVQNITY